MERKSIKVKRIFTKEGKNQRGKVWKRIGIQADNDIWYSFFTADWNEDLQNLNEGDEITITYEKEYRDNKEYNTIINPDDPKYKSEMLEEKVMIIENRINKINERLKVAEAFIAVDKQRMKAGVIPQVKQVTEQKVYDDGLPINMKVEDAPF